MAVSCLRRFSSLRAAILLAAGVSVIAASACTTPLIPRRDRLVSPDERAQRVRVDHDAYATMGYRLEWRGFPTMTARSEVLFFHLLGDILVAQDSAGVVSVLDATSGITRWSDQPAAPLTRFVGTVRDGNRLIVSSESEAFFMDVETGTLLDRQRLHRVAMTRPVIDPPMLVYGTSVGELFAHLMINGFKAWGHMVDGAIEVEPVLVGDTVTVVSRGGSVLAVDSRSGSARGTNRMYAGSEAPLAASDTQVFVASLDQSIYAFDARNASLQWSKLTDTRLRYAPVYHDGRVYCTVETRGLLALDARTGGELWVAEGIIGTVVAQRDGRLIVWDGRREVVLLDPARGDVIDRVRVDNVAFMKADRFVDGNLYAVSANGVVAKFVPR